MIDERGRRARKTSKSITSIFNYYSHNKEDRDNIEIRNSIRIIL